MTAPHAQAGDPAFEDVAAGRSSLGSAVSRIIGVLLRPEMMRWRGLIVLAIALTLASKVFAVAAPVFFGDAVNAVAAGTGAAAIGTAFVGLFFAYAGARFLSNALPQARDAFFAAVTQDAQRVIAVEAFAHAQGLPLQFHLTRRTGALQRVIERGAAAMEYLLRFLAFNIGPTLIELALASVVLWVKYGAGFAVATVATVAAYVAFTGWLTEWRARQRRVLNEADTELRARSVDSLSNFETVKAFAAETRETGRFDAALKSYNVYYVRLMQSLAGLNVGQEAIMTAGLLAAALLAGFGAVRGELQAGDAAAVTLILLNIYRPLNILGWAWREIRQGVIDMEKLFGLFEIAPTVADKPGAPDLPDGPGSVRFQGVSFTHEGRANGLEAVDFEIPAGAFVGVAGPSGAGKSTVLKLLFRFYDPAEGAVSIDGVDLRDVAQASVRRTLGLVPQEVVLFNDTLRYNLAYAVPDASEAAILAAAERAQLSEFISRLPQGLETRVGERGLKLSGGEKQRVGLARAILKDPRILVLDEATSSLDSETETEVQAALADAAKGRTTIAVAHRLSTIAHADLILVFDDGRLVERGRHAELILAGGRYAAMWRRQSGEHAGEEDAANASPKGRETVGKSAMAVDLDG